MPYDLNKRARQARRMQRSMNRRKSASARGLTLREPFALVQAVGVSVQNVRAQLKQ
ncbi:MAG: hypothetical protein JWO88_3604 [Frankiales bacterium]|nr:hypothetical protein [Frankiales bacterium]